MGAMASTVNRTMFFTATSPHLGLSVHFACPIGIPYTSMRRILMPFSREIWFCTVASILLVAFLLCLNKKAQSSPDNETHSKIDYVVSLFDVLESFLGLPIAERTLHENAMLGLILWLLTTFILRNVYLGSLFNLLADQVNEDPVDTIERIIEHQYTVYCTPATYELLHKSMPHLRAQ